LRVPFHRLHEPPFVTGCSSATIDINRYNEYRESVNVRLKEEIKQSKHFESLETEAFLNLQRTADALLRGVEELLKPWGLTQTQYNALRILRGAGERGLLCREVGERMVTRDPDVTRLLDRLDSRGLIERSRDPRDRRVIITRITESGLKVLAGIDAPLEELHRRQLGHLGETNIRQLIRLLENARSPGNRLLNPPTAAAGKPGASLS
jgi:DNA-binding MarR family transcriptional regulator